MKLHQYIDGAKSLEALAGLKTPASVTWKIAMAITKAQEQIKLFEQAKNAAVQNMSDRDTDGNPLIVNGHYQFTEHGKEFQQEMRDLLNQEVDEPMKIAIAEFKDLPVEGTTLIPLMDWLIIA